MSEETNEKANKATKTESNKNNKSSKEKTQKKATKATKSQSKHRFFAFILYPESLPKDWQDSLEALDVPIAISPLHDKDKVSKSKLTDEEKVQVEKGKEIYKKSHYHVMYMAKNPVTPDSVRRRIKRTLGNNVISHVEIVDSPRNMYLYLTHDSKDAIRRGKHKYDVDDIVELNGFDIDRYIVLDQADKDDIYNVIADFIEEYQVENYAQLVTHDCFNLEELGIHSKREFRKIWKEYGSALVSMMTGFYQMRLRKEQEEAEKRAQEAMKKAEAEKEKRKRENERIYGRYY